MVLGADGICDTGVLRACRTCRLLGGWLPAPSTLGTFLRAFTFGHVRQLDALLGAALERARKAGAGPGGGRLVIDVDSFRVAPGAPWWLGRLGTRDRATLVGELRAFVLAAGRPATDSAR